MRLTPDERRQLADEYLATRLNVTLSDIYPGMVIAYQMTTKQRQRRKKLHPVSGSSENVLTLQYYEP